MSPADHIALCEARARIIVDFAAEMARYDAFMLPTVPIAPPEIAISPRTMRIAG